MDLRESFTNYAVEIDTINARRERIVKASRDVTIASKKVISTLQRLSGSPGSDLAECEKALASIRQNLISGIAKELDTTNYWKFWKSFSPGLQEYVEAMVFLNFCKSGDLLSLVEVNKSLDEDVNPPLHIELPDYLLGVADVTGEVMRLAISDMAKGGAKSVHTSAHKSADTSAHASAHTSAHTSADTSAHTSAHTSADTSAHRATGFVGQLYRGFLHLPPNSECDKYLTSKLEVMLQSLTKIETADFRFKCLDSEASACGANEELRNAFLAKQMES